MFLSRMNIKSFNDETGKRIVKIDFNTIKVIELFSENKFQSCVSQEIITITKKNHLSFHLTKMDCGGTMFVYEYLDTKKEKSEDAEKSFFKKAEKHFKWFSFFFKKEMAKLTQMKGVLLS